MKKENKEQCELVLIELPNSLRSLFYEVGAYMGLKILRPKAELKQIKTISDKDAKER